jgi:hypothetical protein
VKEGSCDISLIKRLVVVGYKGKDRPECAGTKRSSIRLKVVDSFLLYESLSYLARLILFD